MAYVLADRVKETTTTVGTGDIALGGAVTAFRAFSAVCANGDTCYYTIAHQSGADWEVGLGTWGTGNILTRTTVLSSSNAGSLVSLSAGTKDVFLSAPAAHLPVFPNIAYDKTNNTLQLGSFTTLSAVNFNFYTGYTAPTVTLAVSAGNGLLNDGHLAIRSTGLWTFGYIWANYGQDNTGGDYIPGMKFAKNSGHDVGIDIGGRFKVGVDGSAETGNNAGSDFYVLRMNDAGGGLDYPFRIDRDTGFVQANNLGITMTMAARNFIP